MGKNEFLSQLKKALENELAAQRVREHVEYYENYIRGEMEKGASEEEILGQLGDPWAIAKTILLSEQINGQEYTSETVETQNMGNGNGNNKIAKSFNWKMIGVIVVIVLALLLILSIVFGVIAIVVRLAIRFAVPLLVIALVWKFFSKK